MSRLDDIFSAFRARGRKGLIAYVTAGDPDVAATADLLPAIQQAGACICEIGFPFSDPLADGPVIQDSMAHALSSGLRPQHIFEAVAGLRSKLSMGLVAMVSYSIVHRHGSAAFIHRAADAGFDGLIFPDLPLEESQAVRREAAQAGLSCILLIAPSTPPSRARDIANASSGFLYLLARAGLTGLRDSLPPDLPARIHSLRQASDLPIGVGFGISTPEQVSRVVQYADAAIVGSAIVQCLVTNRGDAAQAIRQAAGLVASLVQALPTEGRSRASVADPRG